MKITEEQALAIKDAAWRVNGNVRSYSGRAMYGDRCLGVEFPGNGYGGFGEFILTLAENEERLAETLAHSPKADNMGMDTILYWPDVEFPVEWEDDDD